MDAAKVGCNNFFHFNFS